MECNLNLKRKFPVHSYVSKEIMSAGPSLIDRPKEGAKCTLFLSNIYVDDSVDRSYSEYFKLGDDVRDLTITIGEADCELDRGLDYALCNMTVGEESKILLLQDNNSSKEIKCFVKLISCEDIPFAFQWSIKEKIKFATNHKEKGNILFNQNRILDAFHRFNKAIKFVISISKNSCICGIPERKELYITLCSNMALCQMHFKNYNFVIDLCNKALSEMPENIKCLLRRMDAYIHVRDFGKAHADCTKVLEISPNNSYAKKKLLCINEYLASEQDRYAIMVKKMFTIGDMGIKFCH